MKPFSLFYVNFPAGCEGTIYGMTGKCWDGGYIIAIDSSQDERTQENALKHELSHILLNHFESKRALEEVEREADEHAQQMTKAELDHLLTFCRKKEVKPPDFMKKLA